MLNSGRVFAERYRILRPLAQGGMGAVYVAEHLGTEARIALKILLPKAVHDPTTRQKFILEARIAARIKSEYIVHVLDCAIDRETSMPFIAMELLEGQTLAQCVRQHGPLPWAETLRVIRQLASGLDSAHSYRNPKGKIQPIIHRDLKPENIFLTRLNEGEVRLKILDFGIAKVLGESTEVSQVIRGTPLFLSPEQLSEAPVSPGTDVWALGLITHYVLTGRHYWSSAGASPAGLHALYAEILGERREAPSKRLEAAGVESQTLPGGFDNWLLRCLARDPRERYSSAGEAVRSLASMTLDFDAKSFWNPPPLATARASLAVSSPSVGESAEAQTHTRKETSTAGVGLTESLVKSSSTGVVPRWRSLLPVAVVAGVLVALLAPSSP